MLRGRRVAVPPPLLPRLPRARPPVKAGEMAAPPEDHDVAILGTGIGGTILASILARNGVKTLMLEEGVHPRFAVGESMVPATGALMRIVADRYDVPELRYCGNFAGVRDHISPACGVKRSFTFAYHHEAEEQRRGEMTQVLTGRPPFGPDSHLFRQDVDAYLLAVALRYGATVQQQARVTELRRVPGERGSSWHIETSRGRSFGARYLVDASGFRSFLAEKLGLRVRPLDMLTNSRSIFTHMVGVKPYEACSTSAKFTDLPSRPSQGTLHHLFPGGWIWVIPFDNHPESTNPLCSVGLQLDMRRASGGGTTGEDEFARVLARYPSIAQQFSGASAIRPWIATERLQYASHQVVGDGWCLLPHAAGFVDALYSSGLAMTLSVLNSLGGRLIRAARANDFSTGPFAYVDTCTQADLRHVDRLVACSYTAFDDFPLWNAWFRVFVLGAILWNFALNKIHLDYVADGDPAVFDALEAKPYRGVLQRDNDEYASLFEAAAGRVEAVQRGEASAADAAAAIFDLVRRTKLVPPHFRLGDPDHRYVSTFTPLSLLRLLSWRHRQAPAHVRRQFFGFRMRPLLQSLVKDRLASGRNVARRATVTLLGDFVG